MEYRRLTGKVLKAHIQESTNFFYINLVNIFVKLIENYISVVTIILILKHVFNSHSLWFAFSTHTTKNIKHAILKIFST